MSSVPLGSLAYSLPPPGASMSVITGAIGIEQHGFLPGRELDDAVVDIEARILGDLLFDEEPLPALVDLTLVVVDALRRKVGEAADVLAIDEAAEVGVGGAIAERRR